MRRIHTYGLSLVLAGAVLAFAGCGGKDQPDSDAKPEPQQTAAPQTSPMPDTAPDAPATPETPATPGDTPAAAEAGATAQAGDAAALIGTSWLVGDMHVTFKSPTELFVKGGMVAEVAPDGLTAQYTMGPEGTLEATAMGVTMQGTWDGTNLTVGGVPAQPQ